MPKTTRVAHAPETPLPELDEFLGLFQFKFRRRESREATERYLTGLLTEHPNKNCDTLAAVVPGHQRAAIAGLLTDMVWDEVDMTRQRVASLEDAAHGRRWRPGHLTTQALPNRARRRWG